MRDYSLDNDIRPEDNEDDDDWEPTEFIEIDNLRLDPEAAARYREIRKARERLEHGLRLEED